MLESHEEMLLDLDETLNQLVENASVLEEIGGNPLFSTERDALQKTQESLLAHLISMETLLEAKKPEKARLRKEVDAKLRHVKKRTSLRKLNTQQVALARRS